ncbi:MAG: hypothetical protein GY796_04330 [Chloroflexi bacterium]|nr:hypothetical protein [Chloroflexota bacterium]
MSSHDVVTLLVFVIEAIFWLGAYALILYHSFRYKTYAMPIIAMCANISWEFIVGVGLFPACTVTWSTCPDKILQPLTFSAAMMDVIILFTILKFGRKQFSKQPFVHKYYYGLILFGIATAFTVIYLIMAQIYTQNIYTAVINGEVPDFLVVGIQGGVYTGWGDALMMGLLFIAMFYARKNLEGQSFYIALFMFLGNIFAYLFDFFAANFTLLALVNVMAAAGLIVNLVYVGMTYNKTKELGFNPWKRL